MEAVSAGCRCGFFCAVCRSTKGDGRATSFQSRSPASGTGRQLLGYILIEFKRIKPSWALLPVSCDCAQSL